MNIKQSRLQNKKDCKGLNKSFHNDKGVDSSRGHKSHKHLCTS